MNETEILNILADWNYWGNFQEAPRDRPDYLARMDELFSARTATVLFGVRRAGKSSLVYLFINRGIKEKRFAAQDTLVINFEDPRFLQPLHSADLFKIFEIYAKHFNSAHPLIVLDEVQNVEGWEKFVRYLLEVKKTPVIITGSSSKLLGTEISTVLTGRHVNLEVLPLSFKEFLQFNFLNITNKIEMAKERILIQRQHDEFVKWGGFPAVVLSESPARKRELLLRYFEDIVVKDVFKRYGIKELEKLEKLAHLLISNMATLQSFNKLKERVGASLDTVERFTNYLEVARMFFFLKKFDFSLGQQMRSINKVYAVDTGLYSAKGFKFSENLGHLAENLVAIELFRRRTFDPLLEIYYWKNQQQQEVDFIVKAGERVKKIIQVCWEINGEETRAREIKSLLKAGSELKCDELYIITNDYETAESIRFNGAEKTIQFIPLWKWLLTFTIE